MSFAWKFNWTARSFVLIACIFGAVEPDPSACPRDTYGNVCANSGSCNVTVGGGKCLCPWDRLGTACQYQRQSMTCENQRYCVQCHLYGTGPLADDADCDEFCHDHPVPLVSDKLIVRKNDVFCSFLGHSVGNEDNCRFYFKLFNLRPISSRDFQYFDSDTFIIVQRTKECNSDDGKSWKKYFPESMSSSNQSILAKEEVMNQMLNQDDEGKSYNYTYTTIFFIFLIISLPFVACVASCIQNMKRLPCGLCNIFRRPTATYLRNVRPYREPISITLSTLSSAPFRRGSDI